MLLYQIAGPLRFGCSHLWLHLSSVLTFSMAVLPLMWCCLNMYVSVSVCLCMFLNFFLSFSQDLQSPYLSPHDSLAVISIFNAPSDSVNHTPPPSFLPELFITCIYQDVPLNWENRHSWRGKSSLSPLSFPRTDIFCITHYRVSHVSWICKCLQMCASTLALKEASVFFLF